MFCVQLCSKSPLSNSKATSATFNRSFRNVPKRATSQSECTGVCHLCLAGRPGYEYEDLFLCNVLNTGFGLLFVFYLSSFFAKFGLVWHYNLCGTLYLLLWPTQVKWLSIISRYDGRGAPLGWRTPSYSDSHARPQPKGRFPQDWLVSYNFSGDGKRIRSISSEHSTRDFAREFHRAENERVFGHVPRVLQRFWVAILFNFDLVAFLFFLPSYVTWCLFGKGPTPKEYQKTNYVQKIDRALLGWTGSQEPVGSWSKAAFTTSLCQFLEHFCRVYNLEMDPDNEIYRLIVTWEYNICFFSTIIILDILWHLVGFGFFYGMFFLVVCIPEPSWTFPLNLVFPVLVWVIHVFLLLPNNLWGKFHPSYQLFHVERLQVKRIPCKREGNSNHQCWVSFPEGICSIGLFVPSTENVKISFGTEVPHVLSCCVQNEGTKSACRVRWKSYYIFDSERWRLHRPLLLPYQVCESSSEDSSLTAAISDSGVFVLGSCQLSGMWQRCCWKILKGKGKKCCLRLGGDMLVKWRLKLKEAKNIKHP